MGKTTRSLWSFAMLSIMVLTSTLGIPEYNETYDVIGNSTVSLLRLPLLISFGTFKIKLIFNETAALNGKNEVILNGKCDGCV